jgi:hypothetical protein
MTHSFVRLSGLALLGACASRGGYAEPGPQSQGAYPPSPQSIQSGNGLQASPASGTLNDRPPSINLGGAEVRDGRPSGGASSPGAECARDEDCVPATCCHPSTCAPAARAPNCSATMCTQNCAPGTLDCGQGRCACLAGRCGALRSPAS